MGTRRNLSHSNQIVNRFGRENHDIKSLAGVDSRSERRRGIKLDCQWMPRRALALRLKLLQHSFHAVGSENTDLRRLWRGLRCEQKHQPACDGEDSHFQLLYRRAACRSLPAALPDYLITPFSPETRSDRRSASSSPTRCRTTRSLSPGCRPALWSTPRRRSSCSGYASCR